MFCSEWLRIAIQFRSMNGTRPESGIGRWVKDPYCSLSHAAGALLSVAALVCLLTFTQGDAWTVVGLAVYGVSLVLLFSASALAHFFHVPELEMRFERLDYAGIFFLIFGTYAPLCLTVLRGPWGWAILGIEGALAGFGIAVMLFTNVPGARVRPLYLPMGWMSVVAAVPLIRLMPWSALIWLFAGGLLYSVGALVFAIQRPNLWPGRFNYHDLWHTMVLAAAGCQFIAILGAVG